MHKALRAGPDTPSNTEVFVIASAAAALAAVIVTNLSLDTAME